MTTFRIGFANLLVVTLQMVAVAEPPEVVKENYRGGLIAIAEILPRDHLGKQSLSEEIGNRWFNLLMHDVDPQRLILTEEDLGSLAELKTGLLIAAKAGSFELPEKLQAIYKERCELVVEMALHWLHAPHDFTAEETFVRLPVPFPADVKALRERWRKQVKYDLLVLKADGVPEAEAKERLEKRYKSFSDGGRFKIDLDFYDAYLHAFARSFGPHNFYYSERELVQFRQ
jgi:carboxyl-terminal processing protease